MREAIDLISHLVFLAMVSVACYCVFDTNRSIEEIKQVLKDADHPDAEVNEVLRHDDGDDPGIAGK